MTTARSFTGFGHAERRPENRCFDVVDRHGVSGEQCRYESILNEPHHVCACARVNEGWASHPDRVATAISLLEENVRHECVVDRLFTRDLARHELELALLLTEE